MEKPSKLRTPNKNEEEIYCVDYEETVANSSHGNCKPIGFSLEVEIAESLRQLISSPENHSSSLLDVTIVRPNGLPGIENATMRGSEIQGLIACMEKQKRKKEMLIQDLKRAQDLRVTKVKQERKRKSKLKVIRNNIAVSSDSKTIPNVEEKPFVNSAPISVLKPLMGQIRESLKNLEEKILEVGDHEKHTPRVKASHTSSNNSDLINEESKRKKAKKRVGNLHDNVHDRNQHVYATVNTFDRLKTLLACQNANAHEIENDKPCLCQRCGTIGLLVESQKRPIMPSLPLQTSPGVWPQNENQEVDSTDTSIDDQYYIIREMALRLRDLEERIAFQEQTTVPKEYFKRVIKKILDLQTAISQHHSYAIPAQSAGTQYNFDHAEDIHRRIRSKTRQRNVQIQQGYGKRYYVSPIMTDSSSQRVFTAISNLIPKPSQEKRVGDNFLRWGEEVIKPGIDLKTKIATLLDEKLQQIKEKNLKRDRSSSETLKKVLELVSKHVKPNANVATTDKKISSLNTDISKKNVLLSKRHRSGIPVRIGNTSAGDFCASSPKNDVRTSLIPKLKTNQTHKSDETDNMKVNNENMIRVTYLNSNAKMWKEISSNSMTETLGETQGVPLRSSSSFQLSSTKNDRKPKRLFKNHSLSDKLEFLKRVASSEIVQTQLWSYIWNQTKTYCKSKNDTVIIQVPTDEHKKHLGIIEIEFSIEDVQRIVQNPNLLEKTALSSYFQKHRNPSY